MRRDVRFRPDGAELSGRVYVPDSGPPWPLVITPTITKLWSNRTQATISCFGLRRSFRDGDVYRSLAHRSDGQCQKIAFRLATVALLLPIPHRLYRELLALCEICRKKREPRADSNR
jgi:hypothetical protein